MKKFLLFATSIAVIFAVSASTQSANQKDNVEQEIRKLDSSEADVVLRGELSALDKIWAQDFKVNTPNNRVSEGSLIRTGAITYSSFIREAESIQIHGDTAIVMGRETVVPKGNSPDEGKTINRRYTNIWMKKDGNWRMVARHANNICQK